MNAKIPTPTPATRADQPLQGEVLSHTPAGQLACRAQFADGLAHGPVHLYDEDGGVRQQSSYVRGLMDGRTMMYADGRLLAEIDYVQGRRHGWFQSYGDTGKLSSRVAYVNDKPHGAAEYFYPGGQLARRAHHVDGLLDGEVHDYDEAGLLLSTTTYARGRRQGALTLFYPNGKAREITMYEDDRKAGAPRRYDENGAAPGAGGEAPPRRSMLSKWIEG
jgi:antitoxin component YwqK of YwqJK toxin-antitoxin module